MPRPSEKDDAPDAAADRSRPHAQRRVVIAENQREHAETLVDLLRRLRPAWRVCAIARDAAELRQAIEDHVPELLLLDVHLDGGNSIDVLRDLTYSVPVVFLSGDPAFAVDAFEHEAVDYLLKPIRPTRLQRSLDKVDRAWEPTSPASRAPEAWLTAHRDGQSVILQLAEVMYFQARAKYTIARLKDSEALIKRGLGQVETLLPPDRFLRVHRSTIINIAHADKLARDDLGRLTVQMRGRPEWLHVSRAFESVFRLP